MTTSSRRTFLQLAAGAAALPALARPAIAQAWPNRPITLVVPFAAGGPVDTVARILSDSLRASLGATIVIENVTGASGTLGVGRVARATPDGYTLSIGHWSTHVVNGAIFPLPFDIVGDLAPIAQLPSNPMIVVSRTTVPAKTLKELTAWLKANDGKVAAGTAGAGSATHVAGVYFAKTIGAQFQFVPYRGTGPALLDLAAGHIDLIVDQASNSLPQIRGGQIRAYAVTAQKRLASAPDIPTVDEAGVSGFHMSLWYGVWAPKGTPRDIIEKLNGAFVTALADATVKTRFAELGLDIPPREQQTPEALAALHRAEADKWWPILRAENIKAN